MHIAIASTRGPKVEAAKAVVKSIKHHFGNPTVRYTTHKITGGIVMPRTLNQLMAGARRRVVRLQRELLRQGKQADFCVGMEGGFHSILHARRRLVFLQSWAYVSDGQNGYFGSSGNVLVPERIAAEVMTKKRDLSDVIDEVAQQVDVRSKQGTWGVLTRDLLTRQQSFETALLAAFAPFYNTGLYHK
jgi:non-canonical (house-cleaning) NTP pyrophosphatase